ncbi:Peptidase M1 membrane alanine aminopeptidase (plasmid) [Gemmatirosa kalamazoonensis]|uniref:Peptidase M1 membrane alanine aminopeptidase n=1 Tax=Gemmatirosa kalamazoonensis TaxID=861299 RepID=W0RNT6_9BACT|nr:M1 family metallopeptidase [Gemmatirosa kalamazoonensis]AHG92401.1 Peptidase M1 membrane alanine aminopeptidase [Gemmatirosa kalamazoonensis]
MSRTTRLAALLCAWATPLLAQNPTRDTVVSSARAPRVTYVPKSSHADTLRGSYTSPGRRWWDVTFYDLHVAVDPKDSSIAGHNAITYRVTAAPPAARELQIDLMEPLVVDSMLQDGRPVRFRRDGNAFFATPNVQHRVGDRRTITVWYHGRPQIARNPPWQGGFTWTADSLGRPWIVTTDQGMGASVWWPNKDTQADEPDSQRVALTVPDPLLDVSNGRLRATRHNDDGTSTFEWFVTNPINNYAIAVAAGHYAHYSDTYDGLKGKLTLDYWPLDYHVADAHRQFPQSRAMLQCFERWFGPYPWYEDGYKLIEVPNTGMEHQSAVSYGNWYANGYRKRESSGTGLGLTWDFIIVHESAHEWFGNNITAKDNADMWVHESFANYAEGIYTECLHGKDAGARYIVGNRRGIRNDRPIIPAYGVNDQGSGDMYPKGGEMLHTIRQLVDDDARWRDILRGLNRTFWHQTVTGRQIEEYIARQSGLNLTKVFDQYLRTTMVPTLEYRLAGDTLVYRWTNVVPGFDMPVKATLDWPELAWLRPTTAWQRTRVRLPNLSEFRVDPNFYVIAKPVDAAAP